MSMKQLHIGQSVQLANMEQIIFTIKKINADGSYEIEAQLDVQNVLNYGHVSPEMLRHINPD